jgi:hypothetical protein
MVGITATQLLTVATETASTSSNQNTADVIVFEAMILADSLINLLNGIDNNSN